MPLLSANSEDRFSHVKAHLFLYHRLKLLLKWELIAIIHIRVNIAYCHVVISGLWIEAAKLVFGMSNNTLVYINILSCWYFRTVDRGSKVGVWNEQ